MSDFIHIPGQGDILHFHHANGFPGGVYRPLLNELSQHFDSYALHGRATWDGGTPSYKNWQGFTDDLIEFAEGFDQPIIAAGHSMGGAISVMAAEKRPELFKALILIEPAMINLPTSLLLKVTPKNLLSRIKLISGTLNKRDNWQTPEAYLDYIKKFHAYQKFSESSFQAFQQSAIKPVDSGEYHLAFPKEWEAHNYMLAPRLAPKLKKLAKLNIPTVAIRGADNMFFPMSSWKTWQRIQSNALFLQDDNYSHLFPLENSEVCSKLIIEGLSQLNLIQPSHQFD